MFFWKTKSMDLFDCLVSECHCVLCQVFSCCSLSAGSTSLSEECDAGCLDFGDDLIYDTDFLVNSFVLCYNVGMQIHQSWIDA